MTQSTNVIAPHPGARDDRRFSTWLAEVLAVPPSAVALTQIAGDASPRRYFRLRLQFGDPSDFSSETESTQALGGVPMTSSTVNQHSWVAVTSPASENNTAFLQVRQMLDSAGCVVPAQYASDLDRGFFLMEDFGDVLLATQLTPDAVDRHYLSALSALGKIAGIPADSVSLPRFDAARIAEELSVFPEWFLRTHLGLEAESMADEPWDDLRALLTDACLSQPQCVVHRDFHSRNIMCLPDDRLGLIDFQDAVVGPITYDPVSLLKDCYIQWPRSDQLRWLENYRQTLLSTGALVPGEFAFIRDFDLVGLQRHLRVLGVFARLCLRDGKPDYLKDLPLVLAYTREALALYESEPAIAAFSEWFEGVVMPRIAAQEWYQQAAKKLGA